MTGTARCWFNMALFAAGIALAQRSTFAASDWEIIKVSGHDKGQVSRYGPENEFAIDVARGRRPLLQAKGLRVIMTREGDYFVPLEVRAKIANAARNSIFVSIHFNATNDNPTATGFEIF